MKEPPSSRFGGSRSRTREALLAECGSPPLRAPTPPECDHPRARQSEPGDGVLHVIVLELDVERTGLRDPACGHRLLQIDVERRDWLAGLAPPQRPRHGEM